MRGGEVVGRTVAGSHGFRSRWPSMNPILARVIAGEHGVGLSEYTRLVDPTPEEDRFAGMCLFNLHELQRARDVLLRARARGCAAAGIELASVYRHLGLLDMSRDALGRTVGARLSVFDQALALRERGVQHYTAGELVVAGDALEGAWALAQEAENGAALLPAIGHALGVVYADRGRDGNAAEYLGQALLGASAARAAQVLATRALCHVYTGRLDDAQRDVSAAEEERDRVPLVLPYLTYVGAALEAARGRLASAGELYCEASRLARTMQEPETEVYAELGRCTVATALGRTAEAAGFVERARVLASSARARALIQLRHAALVARLGHRSALGQLAAAESAFARMGALREQAWAWLNMAAVHVAAQRHAEALGAWARATNLGHALGGSGVLVSEIRLLPSLGPFLVGIGRDSYPSQVRNDVVRLADAVPLRIELRTLGTHALFVGGREVRLELRRALEVLTYLLDHHDVHLDQVLLDLFADSSPQHGRSYFHQVRYELARKVPGLSLPFDATRKTYGVHLEGIVLESDLGTMRRALAVGGEQGLEQALRLFAGPLLPHAESEWACAEREGVASATMRLGVSVLERRFSAGRYEESRELAERLLTIDPWNELLAEYVVRAARAAEGDVVAMFMADQFARRFERELGLVPKGLMRQRRPW